MIVSTEFLILKTQRLFRPEIEEVAESWTLRNKKTHTSYTLNMIMMAKSSLVQKASGVTRTEAMRNSLKICVENPEEKKIFKGLRINGWIILK
jgi:hypothetical protein